MDHDYAHCSDYTDKCPKECFRGELVRDLMNMPEPYPVTFMNLKGTEDCLIKKKEDAK